MASVSTVKTFVLRSRTVSPALRRSPSTLCYAASYDEKYRQLMDATTLSLAPMMEYTDRHFRHLVRLLSNRTLLYTEMVAANALAHEWPTEDVSYLYRFLAQSKDEGASVLQLGGSCPEQLFKAGQCIVDMSDRGHCDYTAINLNCGCPSSKVAGKGCFGAALMDDAPLVAELTKAMYDGTEGRYPITVKCRIGTDSDQAFTKLGYNEIDEEQEYRKLCNFIETVAANGIVTDFSVHARIAVLQKSFSPADNRKIPPLKYHLVQRLVRDYPEFTFSLNGGVETIPQVQEQLASTPGLKGVMIGRAWAADPWSFAMADRLLYGEDCGPTNRLEVLKAYGKHADEEERSGDATRIRRFICKAVMPLFAGEPRAKRYRIALDEIAGRPKAGNMDGDPPVSTLILNAAMEHLSDETLLRTPEESYDRMLFNTEKIGEPSQSVVEWQRHRKETEQGAYVVGGTGAA